ncbi:putative flavin-containing monoamine oxidase AofH [Tolypocladium ophioglossoides CBS 100239]|uniref:monoamine oxidase n=1 Tax=Tolypocladium ophioglossoides (strain CBS 100239) TaxID=1163406 RepID=A0A0L0NLP7_TOLOC|nr:putative flavin-containing monoamine oxidase AofH [Tolypocladium ophioglossoides CBS 100239]
MAIGAGYAGLSVAKTLSERGKSVLVLEAHDRVGGQAWTEHFEDGSYEDYGAMFLGVQQPNMHRLEFGIPIFDVNTKGNSVLNYRGQTFELFWGLGTSQVSLLHALWYCKSGFSFTVLGTIDEGAQKELVVGGGQAIAHALAKQLGDAIRYEEPVLQLDQRNESHVLHHILHVQFTPALPPQKGLRGEVVSPDGYMGLINDVSPHDGRYGMLVEFIAATKAMEFLDMGEEQRRRIVLTELGAGYGQEAASPVKLKIHTMMQEKWSTGCPVAASTPGTWTSMGHWIRKPVD